MSVLRIDALKVLADLIMDEIPELAGAVCPGPAENNHIQTMPSLAIQPERFVYQPNQAQEWRVTSNSTVVYEVGKHEASVTLRLGASTHRQRVILEDKIIQLFLKRELAPGILVTPIATCLDAVVVWELEDEEWELEKVFDKKWFSEIHITGQLPAMTTRKGVYTIEELRLGITHEFDVEFTKSTFDTSPLVEVVKINQDGTIEAV